jgi:signal transduction histidine kinase/ligand-binding sensor domain-containing protein/DNA-binding response OmpR family regulator
MKLFIISLLTILFSLSSNGRSYYFRHYRNENGLSNNTVVACIQDRRGFMWFGTKEGLSRFDGFQFRIFLHDPNSSNTLRNNFITSLCEDLDGWIWIGTAEGICYYIPDNDLFGEISLGDISGMITDIESDDNHSIWISTSAGVYKYDKATKTTSFYQASKYFSPRNISLTKAGDIWITARDGRIYKYDAISDSFSSFRILSDQEISDRVGLVNILDAGNGFIVSTDVSGLRHFDPNTGNVRNLSDNSAWNDIQIRTTYLCNTDEVWMGSETGIYIYNLKTGSLSNLHMVRTDPFSISNNAVRAITQDREGGVWIGTFYGGLNYLPHENMPFEKYYPTGLPGSIDGNVIREIKADSYGNIWMGTEDAGLIKFDNAEKNFTNLSGKINIGSHNVQGVMVDGNDLWIGTYTNGIFIMSISSGSITRHFNKDSGCGLRTDKFITFLKAGNGDIYAGSGSGIYRYDRKSSSFSLLKDVAGQGFIHVLHEDHQGNIWIGTYGSGLYKYSPGNGRCDQILSSRGDYEDMRFEHITSINEDSRHKIWFTTEGNGFSCLDPVSGEIKRYVPGRDVDNAIFCAVLEDSHAKMWFTSTRGLLRLDPVSGKMKIFTKDDGLLDNNFSYNSAYKDRNGKLYFGTITGLISFYPSEIKENSYDSPVYFTGLQVNGKDYFPDLSGPSGSKSILSAKRIPLKYFQSSISIDFVSPGFTTPNLIHYKYKMEGSDSDWVLICGNRRVYYTNLSPGEYRFRVMSSTEGDKWNSEESVLEFRISPPFWASLPAYIIYVLIAGFVIYILLSFYLKKNSLEQRRKIDIIEANKEKEILNAKISFFTNITHEVRTPLTLIKGPLDRIIHSGLKNSADTEENLQIIKRNTDRLLSLTNQLLDFRKTEKEMFRLNFIDTDLYELTESTFNLFLPYSSEKMISMKLHSPVNHLNIAVDREAITKILSNLLSNALKFADSKVDMYLEPNSEKDKMVKIRVNSDGKPIPAEFSNRIFEPFYQIDFDKPGEKGTGLGLSLARSLAELLHGRLFLDTGVKHLNSFVLEIPGDQQETIVRSIEQDGAASNEQNEFEIFGSLENTRANILLVEDEIEMGRFIATEISREYNVILAKNGEEALKALKKYNIILVVSDVIMPVVNGYEFCRQLKSNIEFSHIPVILLTATAHLNARIEGLDSGADAFIEKPFSTDLLMAQIVNLIKNRVHEKHNFINTPLAHFRSVAMNKTDQEFLKKLHSSLMDNISENDLSVEKVAELMDISVSTLYRKVKALTDLNTIEYIRLVRLKKAAELLTEGNYRINEISYLVGFSSPSYFATSFQKQFGLSPSQFSKNLK